MSALSAGSGAACVKSRALKLADGTGVSLRSIVGSHTTRIQGIAQANLPTLGDTNRSPGCSESIEMLRKWQYAYTSELLCRNL